MSKHFTHLHVHTEYSLLDGAIPVDKLVSWAKTNNMNAIGISDHGNIFGAVKFFQHAKKAGIKPVLGMEAYLTDDTRIKDATNKYYHLLLIVENEIGYKNLCKLTHFAYTEGFYFKPRIDYRVLEEYSEGLTVTTACLGGHLPNLLMQERHEDTNKWLDWYLRVFGPERFFLEVQPEDQHDQKVLNEKIFTLGKERGIQLVATGDSHYIHREDREAHEVMLAIQTHHKITDPDRFSFGECRAYLRTTEEMLTIFKDHEDALWNTGKIADRCSFEFRTGKLFFPQFEVPAGQTNESYFVHLCKKGLQQLFDQERIDAAQKDAYFERLEIETSLIIKMGFVGYFLVVGDFIQWAKAQNIPVGPGRGSAAGSLVAWALQITDIDPIKYNLLFERFLNPERISMPDIDIDFCIEQREDVINYVRSRYGHDKVCQIITFGTMMAKGVIKDVARALGFSFEDSNALTDLIPDQLKITLKEAMEQEPKLKELAETNPRVATLISHALKLEGLVRHASKHAAGIVISPEPIREILPVYVPPKTPDLVTQYAMTELESLGFLKMDFLGLKNLTLIRRTVDLIAQNHGVSIDINKLPLDDDRTFTLLSQGKTSGVFQLESDGLKDVLRRLQPSKFEDIIAVNALYRPGPLGSGMVDDYIERRHGRQKISYQFDELAPILEETYGVIVYQEQVMKIASAIGGYSLGEADILRRAMGKKKADEMAKQQSIFVERAIKKGFNETKARELFDLMAYFAGYGFNKSHSAAYALIAYQTAYLKTHYTAEFLACLISLESDDIEKMAFYIQEAKEMGLALLPPDINKSAIRFSVEEGGIRFGLQGIKNVGLAALEDIFLERNKKPFHDIFDFCLRTAETRGCNKRVIESLICAGAFDSIPGKRSQKYEELPKIIELALAQKQSLLTGQMGLFDSGEKKDSDSSPSHYAFQPREEWADSIKLEREKEVLGMYVSAQPLDSYRVQLGWLGVQPIAQGRSLQQEILVCGVVKSKKVVTTKKGDKMAFLSIEDRTATAEIVLFPKTYQRVAQYLESHSIFLVRGSCEGSSDVVKIKAHDCFALDEILTLGTGLTKITIDIGQNVSEQLLSELQRATIPGTLACDILFIDQSKNLRLACKNKVALTPDLSQFLKNHDIGVTLTL